MNEVHNIDKCMYTVETIHRSQYKLLRQAAQRKVKFIVVYIIRKSKNKPKT